MPTTGMTNMQCSVPKACKLYPGLRIYSRVTYADYVVVRIDGLSFWIRWHDASIVFHVTDVEQFCTVYSSRTVCL